MVFQAFLDSNDMMPKHSLHAYRPLHGTETALSKVYINLLLAADGGQVSAIVLTRSDRTKSPQTLTLYISADAST